jgi:hypothetical protein
VRRVFIRAGLVIVFAAMVTGGTGCDTKGADARKTAAKAVQQAAPAARRGAWHGTVTVRTTASGDFPDPSDNEFSQTTHSVNFLQTANFSVNGEAQANVSMSEQTDTRFRYDYDSYTISGTQNLLISASGRSPEARVNLEIYADGRYTIDFFARGVDGEQTTEMESQLRCKPRVDPECRDQNNESRDVAPVLNLAGASGGVEGRIDRKSPNAISGSFSEGYGRSDPVVGRTVISWELSR